MGLTPIIRRYCAVCTAAFLFFSLPFLPTRLNPSDDLTRDRQVRSPTLSVFRGSSDRDALFDLSAIPKTCKSLLTIHNRGVWRQGSYLSRFSTIDNSALEFDCARGYPGEGPHFSLIARLFLLGALGCSWIFRAMDFVGVSDPFCVLGPLIRGWLPWRCLPPFRVGPVRHGHADISRGSYRAIKS